MTPKVGRHPKTFNGPDLKMRPASIRIPSQTFNGGSFEARELSPSRQTFNVGLLGTSARSTASLRPVYRAQITSTAVLYDIRMEHIEMHLVLRPSDINVAVDLDLLEDPDDEFECKACQEVVGHYEEHFYPFAIVLNSSDEDWLICYECYWAVVHPTKSLSD